MKTTIAAVMLMLLAAPADAQQRQAAPRAPAPAESIWGRNTAALADAFDGVMIQSRYTTRIDPVVCEVTRRLVCESQVRGVPLRIAGQAEPEQVREIRVLVNRASRGADVALVAHALMAIAEPRAPEAERREAVLRLLGIGGPQADVVTVGGTEARFADSFSGPAFVFRPKDQAAR